MTSPRGPSVGKMARACDSDVTAAWERCRDGLENTVLFPRYTLVELARAVAEGITLGIRIIGNSLHPLRETVCVLS